MPKVKDVLTHLKVEQALRIRQCGRNKNEHKIAKGETCLAIRDNTYGAWHSYCQECATEILGAAEAKLANLKSEIG
jgi:hypothetical protein